MPLNSASFAVLEYGLKIQGKQAGLDGKEVEGSEGSQD
jgi:hypothetical protein